MHVRGAGSGIRVLVAGDSELSASDCDEGRHVDGMTSAEREKLRRLRRKNRQLREEREILRTSRLGSLGRPGWCPGAQDDRWRGDMMPGSRRNTGPEFTVRRLAHKPSLRFRLQRKGFPGRPDLILPGCRVAGVSQGCSGIDTMDAGLLNQGVGEIDMPLPRAVCGPGPMWCIIAGGFEQGRGCEVRHTEATGAREGRRLAVERRMPVA